MVGGTECWQKTGDNEKKWLKIMAHETSKRLKTWIHLVADDDNERKVSTATAKIWSSILIRISFLHTYTHTHTTTVPYVYFCANIKVIVVEI